MTFLTLSAYMTSVKLYILFNSVVVCVRTCGGSDFLAFEWSKHCVKAQASQVSPNAIQNMCRIWNERIQSFICKLVLCVFSCGFDLQVGLYQSNMFKVHNPVCTRRITKLFQDDN